MSFIKLLYSLAIRMNAFKTRLRSAYWKAVIRHYKGHVGNKFTVRSGASFSFSNGSEIKIGSQVTLAEHAAVFVGPNAKLFIGSNVFIGRGATIVSNKELSIGEGSQLAHYVTIIDTDHKFGDRKAPLITQGSISAPVQIGNNVWIGTQAVILKGKTIGEHAVIGAGALVTQDVPPRHLAVGNPARIIER